MSKTWTFVNDDSLLYLDKTVSFLMEEYCSPKSDAIWSENYFRWKLSSMNPAGAGYLSLAIADGRVIGVLSITKKRLVIDGKEYIGGELGDGYTSLAWRQMGQPEKLSQFDKNPDSYINKSIFGHLATETISRAKADGISLIYGTPNNLAYPRWTQRLGCFDLERSNIKSYIRPTSKWITSTYPKTLLMKSALKNIDSGLITLLRNINKLKIGKSLTIVEEPLPFTQVDELWKRLKLEKGFALVRDSKYWQHRYLEHPLSKYSIFTIRKSGQLCGIIVTRLYRSDRGQLNLAILEWMMDEHIPFKRVIAEILYFFRGYEVNIFHCYANKFSKDAGELNRSLFITRSSIPVIFLDTPMARSVQNNNNRFELQMGNTDAL